MVRRDEAVSVNSVYIAASTASFAAVAPFFYRSTIRSRRSTTVLIPFLSGSVSATAWHFLCTKPINSDNLDCPACASTRGAAMATLTGCILPSITVAYVRYSWKAFRNLKRGMKQLSLFIAYCLHPYSNGRPYMLGFGGLQAILGYFLASWEFNENFARRKIH